MCAKTKRVSVEFVIYRVLFYSIIYFTLKIHLSEDDSKCRTQYTQHKCLQGRTVHKVNLWQFRAARVGPSGEGEVESDHQVGGEMESDHQVEVKWSQTIRWWRWSGVGPSGELESDHQVEVNWSRTIRWKLKCSRTIRWRWSGVGPSGGGGGEVESDHQVEVKWSRTIRWRWSGVGPSGGGEVESDHQVEVKWSRTIRWRWSGVGPSGGGEVQTSAVHDLSYSGSCIQRLMRYSIHRVTTWILSIMF